MKRRVMAVAYGKGYTKFSLPEERVTAISQDRRRKSARVTALVKKAINNPLGAMTLKEAVKGKKRILVVVPDSTRKAHLNKILPELLKPLMRNGRKVEVIVATGLHKKHTRRELEELAGSATAGKCRVISHEQREGVLVNFGKTTGGVPVVLNRKVKDCDFLISVGLVEPHLYAGYSGGYKTVAIGLAGEETISATHGLKFLDDPLTRIGAVEHNPFQDALREISSFARIGYTLNMVNDRSGRPLKAFAGNPPAVFNEAVNFARGIFETKVTEPADIVICGVGYPKDVNLYQASRALNYVANVDRPVLKKGGTLIVAAGLKHGVGDGVSEQRFFRELKRMTSPGHFIKSVKKRGCVAGEHRAYMVAKALKDYNVIFVNKKKAPYMDGLPFRFCRSIREALTRTRELAGKSSRVYVIPHVLTTVVNLT